MVKTIRINCRNTGTSLDVPAGSTLEEIFELFAPAMPLGPTSAKVNNKVEGLHYAAYNSQDVEFLDITSTSGMRTYIRSLTFVLYKAVSELYPGARLRVQAPVSNGYYCRLDTPRPLAPADVDAIRTKMQQIVDTDMPFHRITAPTTEAVKLFRERGLDNKAKLLESYGRLYTNYHTLGDSADYFYGSLLIRTGQITLFDIAQYYDGILLRIPDPDSPTSLKPLVKQEKMFEVFREHHEWQHILGISTIGEFNEAMAKGYATDLINVSEALQEKKISRIADDIKDRSHIRMVLVSGPSSSGKTTFSKRLSVQLMACGIRPYAIPLDNYFVDRDKTPRDATGEYDFEHIEAIDLPRLAADLRALIAGEEIELPTYNFRTGKSEQSGQRLRITPDMILILEGIHALNPRLTADVPDLVKYKVYASALTTVLLDDHNYIPTSDNRLLRRIVRDHKYRGYTAADTISRWPSVQAGERKWIFPYQENADAMFNSALIFELAALRTQAMPLLEEVPECSPEYSEAYRLHKFLSYITPMSFTNLPPTSLLREFIGGSSFKY